MQLSKHFTLEEFEKSQTATRKGIKNKAGSGEIKNLGDLCYEVLEPVRAKFDKPVTITSGYRSEELCEAIGSSKNSQHAKGEAADFEMFGVDNKELAKYIKNNLVFDQLILEFYNPDDPSSGWVHCSYSKEENRKESLLYNGKDYTEWLT